MVQKSTNTLYWWEREETWTCLCWSDAKRQNLFVRLWGNSFKKLNLAWHSNPSVRNRSRRNGNVSNRNTPMHMFTAILSLPTQIGKQSSVRPLVSGLKNKKELQYVCAPEHCTKKEQLFMRTTWINLKNILMPDKKRWHICVIIFLRNVYRCKQTSGRLGSGVQARTEHRCAQETLEGDKMF